MKLNHFLCYKGSGNSKERGGNADQREKKINRRSPYRIMNFSRVVVVFPYLFPMWCNFTKDIREKGADSTKEQKKDSDIDFEDVKVSYYNGDEEMRKKIWKDILEVAYGV
jgi:hypothetical protein